MKTDGFFFFFSNRFKAKLFNLFDKFCAILIEAQREGRRENIGGK